MSQIRYRDDIDGIRALVVVLVRHVSCRLGLHRWIQRGRFFFVLSVYLIRHIVTRDISAGAFRFTRCLAAESALLFPDLTVLLLVTHMTGVLLFFPNCLQKLSESIIAQPLLYANILF